MKIIPINVREGGEAVAFYEVDEDKKPVADAGRIGVLSLASTNVNARKREVKLFYAGELEAKRLSEIPRDSELEAAVIQTASEYECVKRGIFHVDSQYPAVIGSFVGEGLGWISLIDLVARDRVELPFVLDYTGNIEIVEYAGFMNNFKAPLGIREMARDYLVKLRAYQRNGKR